MHGILVLICAYLFISNFDGGLEGIITYPFYSFFPPFIISFYILQKLYFPKPLILSAISSGLLALILVKQWDYHASTFYELHANPSYSYVVLVIFLSVFLFILSFKIVKLGNYWKIGLLTAALVIVSFIPEVTAKFTQNQKDQEIIGKISQEIYLPDNLPAFYNIGQTRVFYDQTNKINRIRTIIEKQYENDELSIPEFEIVLATLPKTDNDIQRLNLPGQCNLRTVYCQEYPIINAESYNPTTDDCLVHKTSKENIFYQEKDDTQDDFVYFTLLDQSVVFIYFSAAFKEPSY